MRPFLAIFIKVRDNFGAIISVFACDGFAILILTVETGTVVAEAYGRGIVFSIVGQVQRGSSRYGTLVTARFVKTSVVYSFGAVFAFALFPTRLAEAVTAWALS